MATKRIHIKQHTRKGKVVKAHTKTVRVSTKKSTPGNQYETYKDFTPSVSDYMNGFYADKDGKVWYYEKEKNRWEHYMSVASAHSLTGNEKDIVRKTLDGVSTFTRIRPAKFKPKYKEE